MAYTSWRGVIGCIKPTLRPGGTEELIRLLPEGIGVIPLFLNIREGTRKEFSEAVPAYLPQVEELVEQEVDLILPEGAPPFMLKGFKGEAALIRGWEKKYKTTMFTSGQNQVNALHALKAKKIVGATYAPVQSQIASKYFKEAGFDVLAMEAIDVSFEKVGQVSPQEIYAHIKKAAIKHPKADAIYMLGTGWRSLDVIDMLEQDLGKPVVHAVTARSWEVQKRLHVNQKQTGYGHLLEAMPAMV
jgi:maleate isomerase